MRFIPSCLLLAFLLLTVLLGSSQLKGDIQQSYLIKNGTLLTMTEQGTIKNGDILVQDGRIVKIGVHLTVDSSVELIDVGGAIVTPGLFDSGTQLGLAEVGTSSISGDDRAKGQQLGAGFSISLALNRHSSMIPMARRMGITRAMVVPQPGSEPLSGQSALVQLGGSSKFAIDKSNAVHLYIREADRKLVGGSRASMLMQVLESFHEARRYQKNIRAYQRGKTRKFRQSEPDLKALTRVLSGDIPLVIHIDRAADIELVLDELSMFDLRIVLSGAREAWKVRDQLVQQNIPVLLNVIDNLPRKFDRLGARLDNASLLVEAGVLVAFKTADLYTNTRMLTQGAGIAVAYGLDWEDALRAITVNPAKIWGLNNSGVLAAGSVADLVIWDGDPLEVMSAPTRLMIDGQWISLRTRQDLLRERYSHLEEKTVPYGYR